MTVLHPEAAALEVAAERARAALTRVCDHAGVKPPPLRVGQESFACVERVDGVDQIVLGPKELALPTQHLEAVLAHELGHIEGRHHRLGYLMVGLLLVTALGGVGLALAAVVADSRWGVLAGLTVASTGFTPFLPAWLSRRRETAADDFAARLGYAHASIDELTAWAATAHEPTSRLGRSVETHPSADARIARFRRHLEDCPDR